MNQQKYSYESYCVCNTNHTSMLLSKAKLGNNCKRKIMNFTNILWLSVKRAFLCFYLAI